MPYTRVFQSGNSQAVRLPKEFRLDVGEVEIFRRGDDIVLRPRKPTTADWLAALSDFSDDFMEEGRQDSLPQARESLDE